MRLLLAALILIVGTIPAGTQWLDRPTPGIPRKPDGLAAPTCPDVVIEGARLSASRIHRHLTKRSEDCVVVSPSMVPKRSGDRVKTGWASVRLSRRSRRTASSSPSLGLGWQTVSAEPVTRATQRI